MRITGGDLRSRRLKNGVPRGVRPTASRVREALFSILGQDLSGWSVLDAAGGTGMLAFEAFSRGARPVQVIERRPAIAQLIRQSARDLSAEIEVVVADTLTARIGEFDVILADPPYDADIGEWVTRLLPYTRRCLVLEHEHGRTPPEGGGDPPVRQELVDHLLEDLTTLPSRPTLPRTLPGQTS